MPKRTIYSLFAAVLLLSLGGSEALAQRKGSPSHVQVVQFADYAYREPDGGYTTFGGQGKYANRTTFLAFNGSNVEAKVRFQAFFSNGDLAWEYDMKILPMGGSQLLRYTLDKESKVKPDVFVVSSETPVILTVHTIESQMHERAFTTDGEWTHARATRRASQTHIPVKEIDCGDPTGYESLCAAPTQYVPWNVWIDAP